MTRPFPIAFWRAATATPAGGFDYFRRGSPARTLVVQTSGDMAYFRRGSPATSVR